MKNIKDFNRLGNAELCASMVDLVKDIEIYDDVLWGDIPYSYYQEAGEELRKSSEHYNEFRNASIFHVDDIFNNLSDSTYDFIRATVETTLLRDYYFDYDIDMFLTIKNIEMVKTLLDENEIAYKVIDDDETIFIETSLNKGIKVWISDYEYALSYDDRSTTKFLYDETLLDEIKHYISNGLWEQRKQNNLLDKYGEYGIPFKEIKKLGCYDMSYNMDFEEMKNYVFTVKEDGECGSTEVLAMLQLGNFDIEFCEYGYKEDGTLDTGFFCCARYKESGWQSEDFADLEVYKELFDAKDIFEETMYSYMIDYMKKHGFKWSELNTYDEVEVALEEEVNVNPVVKYDLNVKYKGMEFYDGKEIYRVSIEGVGVPIICEGIYKGDEDRVIYVNDFLLAKYGDKYAIEDIEQSDGQFVVGFKYCYGISQADLRYAFENAIEKGIREEIKSYVVIDGKKYKCNNLKDFMNLGKKDGIDEDGVIEEVDIDNPTTQEILEDYIECGFVGVVRNMWTLLYDVGSNESMLIKILQRFTVDEITDKDFWYYESEKDLAIEEYLEEVFDIPSKAFYYMDTLGFIENEANVDFIETDDCTLIYEL